MKKIAILLIALMVIGICFLSGCNEQKSKEGAAPIINFFTATPTNVILRNSSVLNWSVTGATRIIINNGIGNVSLNGSLTVVPMQNQTYTLTAINSYGSSNLSVIVYVHVNNEGSGNQNGKKSYFVSINGKGNYSSIQEAIDSASNNDTIFVSKGTYFENIKIKKSIELIGENKNTTIINGNGSGIIINISADYVNISGFTIMNGGPISADESNAGIKIGSNYNTISDCNISSNKNYGIYLYANPKTTNNNIIKFNTFSNNKYGIFAFFAKLNNISSNTFTNNTDYGIYLEGSSNINLISDNKFIENNYAIRITGSAINTIVKNLIMNNKNGLLFCCGAEKNIVYNNVFINNTNYNAKDDQFKIINTWDNGTVGNYWDDYNGIDANGDGIGDTPYLINGDKGDRFPLMKHI